MNSAIQDATLEYSVKQNIQGEITDLAGVDVNIKVEDAVLSMAIEHAHIILKTDDNERYLTYQQLVEYAHFHRHMSEVSDTDSHFNTLDQERTMSQLRRELQIAQQQAAYYKNRCEADNEDEYVTPAYALADQPDDDEDEPFHRF